MNSMLWLRSLQEVFAPFRIFYVKDSQFVRSRGMNASSHGPAARQGSRFRGSIHLSRAIRFVLSDRAASRIRPCGVAYQKAARRHAGCAYRRGDPRRAEETARGDLLHGPLPRVASAFVFRHTWLRLRVGQGLSEGEPDAGMPGCPTAVSLLRSTFFGSACLGAQHPLFQHPQDLAVLSAVELAGKELVRALQTLPVGQREHLGV